MTGRVAYFTMEIGLESDIPTYSGGLGVLAGNTAREAADMGLPVHVVSLVHRTGYFRQRLDPEGRQSEGPERWDPSTRLDPLDPRVQLRVEGQTVTVRGWVYRVRGARGEVPVVLLDTDLPENHAKDRRITDALYGGDRRLRLRQELVLGVGGVRFLRALGLEDVETFHMNEGHSAFLALELRAGGASPDDVRRRCVFTTHTPVPAGHDRFTPELVREVAGPDLAGLLDEAGLVEDGHVNTSRIALHHSRFANGVAWRHSGVAGEMFPGRPIHPITNGIHPATWAGDAMQALFDREVPGWRQDPFLLRHAVAVPLERFREARRAARERLRQMVMERTGRVLRDDALTVVFARRAAPYKRADLMVSRPERLLALAERGGPVQLVYAGRAHPRDERGKEIIRRIVKAGAELGDRVPLVYLEQYDMEMARHLVSGADLWLNTPRKPMEASGTSGMKAALNGVPSLSVLDGWWIEGHVEGVTGWAIDEDWSREPDPEAELTTALEKLERDILPLFHGDPDGWARIQRWAVALNGAHFHTRRMLQEYVDRAYRPGPTAEDR